MFRITSDYIVTTKPKEGQLQGHKRTIIYARKYLKNCSNYMVDGGTRHSISYVIVICAQVFQYNRHFV